MIRSACDKRREKAIMPNRSYGVMGGAAALLLAAQISQASAAVVVWQGAAMIEGVHRTRDCTNLDRPLKVGDTLRLVFRPHSIADNGSTTTLTFMSGRMASAIQLPEAVPFSGDLGSVAYWIVITETGGVFRFPVNMIDNAQVSPALFTESTQSLLMTGWVHVFPGCKVLIRALVHKRA
jgi:hypothetical protein